MSLKHRPTYSSEQEKRLQQIVNIWGYVTQAKEIHSSPRCISIIVKVVIDWKWLFSSLGAVNTVHQLPLNQFSRLTYQEKLQVKNTVTLLAWSTGNTQRFANRQYSQTKWLCGCPTKNVLFCFPCLLFGHSRGGGLKTSESESEKA